MSWFRKEEEPPSWLPDVVGLLSTQLADLTDVVRNLPRLDLSPIVEVLHALDERLVQIRGNQQQIIDTLNAHSENLKNIEKKPVILQIDATPGQHRRFGS